MPFNALHVSPAVTVISVTDEYQLIHLLHVLSFQNSKGRPFETSLQVPLG